jgi:transmembrane sensor
MPRDFKKALEGVGANHSEQADRRLRARLAGGPARPRRVRWARVGGVGALLAVALAVVESLGGFAVIDPSVDLAATAVADVVTLTAGRCVLRDDALGSLMQLGGPVQLRRLSDGVELAAGTVEWDVDHQRARASPFRVRVSHGSIEVLGTQFTVTQRQGSGEVTLHRGSIQFRADDGQVRLLTPGQSLTWPLSPVVTREREPEPEPVPVPTKTPPTLKPNPQRPVIATPQPPEPTVEQPFDAAALLERIAVLRSRGEYEAAVTALTEALTEQHAPATDERLSFELGAILTRQLADAPRACAHWQAHRARFEGGRYEVEIAQARVTLHCQRP